MENEERKNLINYLVGESKTLVEYCESQFTTDDIICKADEPKLEEQEEIKDYWANVILKGVTETLFKVNNLYGSLYATGINNKEIVSRIIKLLSDAGMELNEFIWKVEEISQVPMPEDIKEVCTNLLDKITELRSYAKARKEMIEETEEK